MKLVLQIAAGVFVGSLASQFVFDGWRTYQDYKAQKAAEKIRAEQNRVRTELNERIRAVMQQGRRRAEELMSQKPSAGIAPNDAQGRQPVPNGGKSKQSSEAVGRGDVTK